MMDRAIRREASGLPAPADARQDRVEIKLQYLVFDLYGLTVSDVQLLRSNAPPRDPLALVGATAAPCV